MSDCDVCIGTEDLDDAYAETSVLKDKIAKREHKCHECKSVIRKGEPHEHAAGRDEYWGDAGSQRGWDIYHTCKLCVEVREIFSCNNYWYYGTLWAEMIEYVFPTLTTATKCFTKLSPAAKQFVVERWRKWKRLL